MAATVFGAWKTCLLLLFLLCFLSCNVRGARTKLVELDEGNWSSILEGEWMVEFYAPWCPACKALENTWEEFSSWSDDLGISVGRVDVTSNAGLSGRFMVTALPTIFHVKDGHFRQYRGSRGRDEFINFIEEKKWQGLEEISSWKSPSSIQMSVVSYFFKLSMILRSIHTQLVEQYKFPFWLSLLTFAVATITIGAVLGLLLVCLVDVLFPPKPLVPPPMPSSPTPAKVEPVTPAESDEDKRSNESNDDEDGKGDHSKSAASSEGESASPKVSKQVRRRKKKNAEQTDEDA